MKKKSKNKLIGKHLLILVPLILVISLDLIFTIIGQPSSYWQNYSDYDEMNPLGQMLLSTSPILFIIVSFLYILLVIFLIIKIPKPINIMIYIGFFLGHAWGGASWTSSILSKYFLIELNYFYSSLIYFILIAIISGLCFNKKFQNL